MEEEEERVEERSGAEAVVLTVNSKQRRGREDEDQFFLGLVLFGLFKNKINLV